MGALLLGWFGTGVASVQSQTRQTAIPVPVEILAETVGGALRCRPPTARLPARDVIAFKVVSRTDRPVSFAAPEFFRGADHIESAGFVLDVVTGGFTVAPQSVAQITLRTPAPGRYYYSCFEPGGRPNPDTSGFLDVIAAER